MSRNRLVIIIIIVIAGIVFGTKLTKGNHTQGTVAREMSPQKGSVRRTVSTTGDVEPQNRLEIMPAIDGRIEEILVREGDKVKAGDILALMSSTDRAALLDAAQLKDKEELDYWKEVYNATPLIAPIDGEVIVRSVEPGQTVSSADAVIVLSDRLIVQADVDETDIGTVKVGCKAEISLDAYPGIRVNGTVDHISYESTVVNNVTIYEVDIVPDSIPDVFRSGMSANVEIIVESKDDALLIPFNAVTEENGESFVLIKQGNNGAVRKKVTLGLSDENNIEVVSGVSADDIILISTAEYSLPESKESGGNPFMPQFSEKNKTKK